jgi:peptidoglycan/LPS O-acetylase OafA/YrhL
LTTLAWHYGSIELLGIADGPKFLAGFVRVTVPFFLGAFLFHSRIFQRFPAVPFYAVVVILLSVFFARISVPWLYDLLAVLLIFPAVVCLGARSPVSTPGLRRFCEVSGRISYPLYLLHQPIIRGVIAIFQKLHLPVTGMLPMVFTVVLALACSWAALKFYDEPVRAFLSQRTPRRATESGARACDATS